uniref:Uncharacterized protein n=1 Tax=Arundo donax TaxID=35708 RepID=A0A0A9BQY7_ARUDO
MNVIFGEMLVYVFRR